MNRLCEICGVWIAGHRHHRFPQYKRYRQHYGRLIDAPFNILRVCPRCHTSHASMPGWAIWTEREFREAAIHAGYELPGPMKSYKGGT